MKIEKTRLKQIIKEELAKIVSEGSPEPTPEETGQREVLTEDESMIVDLIAKSAELSPEEARRLISALGKMATDGVLGTALVGLGLGSLQKALGGKSALDDDSDDK